jgi:hypothetical protein
LNITWAVIFEDEFDAEFQGMLAATDKSGSDQKRVCRKLIALAERRYDGYLVNRSRGKRRRYYADN